MVLTGMVLYQSSFKRLTVAESAIFVLINFYQDLILLSFHEEIILRLTTFYLLGILTKKKNSHTWYLKNS